MRELTIQEMQQVDGGAEQIASALIMAALSPLFLVLGIFGLM